MINAFPKGPGSTVGPAFRVQPLAGLPLLLGLGAKPHDSIGDLDAEVDQRTKTDLRIAGLEAALIHGECPGFELCVAQDKIGGRQPT